MSSSQEYRLIKKTADTQAGTVESAVNDNVSSPDGNVVTELTVAVELEDVLDQQPHCSKNLVGNESRSSIRTYKENQVKIKPSPSRRATRAEKRTLFASSDAGESLGWSSDDNVEGIYIYMKNYKTFFYVIN